MLLCKSCNTRFEDGKSACPSCGRRIFVSLKDGYEPTEELRRDLLAFARSRLGAVVAPKEIAFQPSLPKTRSGKIMRRLLRARELGLPEGDTSTLEGAEAEQ